MHTYTCKLQLQKQTHYRTLGTSSNDQRDVHVFGLSVHAFGLSAGSGIDIAIDRSSVVAIGVSGAAVAIS